MIAGGGESSLDSMLSKKLQDALFCFYGPSHFIILEVGRIWPEKDT